MYKNGLMKKMAVFASAAALVLSSLGYVPAKSVKAQTQEGGTGHIYTKFVTKTETNADNLEVGEVYLFSPVRYGDNEAVFKAPTGSARLRLDVKGAYSDETKTAYDSGRGLQGWRRNSGWQTLPRYKYYLLESNNIMGGVAVIEHGDGFDYCAGGTIVYSKTQPSGANKTCTNPSNPEGWYYSCNAGGVKYAGPFYIMSYETLTYSSDNVYVEPSPKFKATGDTKTRVVTQDELSVAIVVDGTTYSAAEVEIDSSNNTISETDNNITLRLGSGEDTVYKTVVLPKYTYIPRYTAENVTVNTSKNWSYEGDTKYVKTVKPADLDVKVTVDGTDYKVENFAIDPANNTIGNGDNDTDVTVVIPTTYGNITKTVTLPGFIRTYSTPIVKPGMKVSNNVGNIGGIKKLKDTSEKKGSSVQSFQGVTDADRELVAQGANINIYLTAEEGDRESVGNKELSKEVKADKKEFGMALDLKVFKDIIRTTGETTSTNLTELVDSIDVEIDIPEALQGKSGYAIYRYHIKADGTGVEIETISNRRNANDEYLTISEDGTKLILTVKKFSDYVLAYDPVAGNDTVALAPKSTKTTTAAANQNATKTSVTVASQEVTNQAVKNQEVSKTATKLVKAPKTGETPSKKSKTPPIMPIAALIFSAAGLMSFRKRSIV